MELASVRLSRGCHRCLEHADAQLEPDITSDAMIKGVFPTPVRRISMRPF